jgi:TPR repeat protein
MKWSDSSQASVDRSSQLQRYRDRAAAGDAAAQRELGRLYLQGFTHHEGLLLKAPANPAEAERLLSLASEQGDAEATLLLGHLYDGPATGMPFDDPYAAYRHYERAVDLGCRTARYHVAAANSWGEAPLSTIRVESR